MAIHIRDATDRDLPGIIEIERLAFPAPWTMASFQRELTLPFSRIMVAIPAASDEHGRDDNGKIAGFLCRWLIADECHVLNIAVHPESRRLGIGTVLLTEAIAEARSMGASVVTLEVRRSNLPARQLYRKFDFEERRLRRHYYGPGEDAIIMELQLS
ncbi:MAG: ribosomal protein S18-alanine N-acetyltransferase [Candidatus Binatus sp.]|jgi:ribosomal-protein-alanine N-acetyltransferase|uniref:ribosomal protein S18-alanine N-acetyltransferase n=1 Tax=Candidatus Binatus sp. TaxID=2811406 RepID=UPI003C955E2C